MSSKYGKWEADYEGRRGSETISICRCEDDREVMPKKIATIQRGNRIPISEARENARLISYAPDMYEMLRASIPHLKAFNEFKAADEVEKVLARIDGTEAK